MGRILFILFASVGVCLGTLSSFLALATALPPTAARYCLFLTVPATSFLIAAVYGCGGGKKGGGIFVVALCLLPLYLAAEAIPLPFFTVVFPLPAVVAAAFCAVCGEIRGRRIAATLRHRRQKPAAAPPH